MRLFSTIVVCVWVSVCVPAWAELRFHFTYDTASIPAASLSALRSAVERGGSVWQQYVHDPVTVNIEISWEVNFDTTRKASAVTWYTLYGYALYEKHLRLDARSTNDVAAVRVLPRGTVPLYINYTEDSPFGVGSDVPYLDNNGDENNNEIRLPFSVQKAVGLRDADNASLDGRILFNGRHLWDLNRADGIAAGHFDFEATLMHEIGHVLGFTSRLDSTLNRCSSRNAQSYTYNFLTPLDLFVFSAESAADSAIDWSLDSRPKYLSLDGGQTVYQPMSTGLQYPDCLAGTDGYTRGHWQNRTRSETPIGIMDPSTVANQSVFAHDLAALDVIGWDVMPFLLPLANMSIGSAGIQARWNPLAGASSYSVLSSKGVNAPFRSIAEIPGTSWGQATLPDGDFLFVQGNVPHARKAKTVAPPPPSTSASCDDPACGCVQIAMDEKLELNFPVGKP